MKAIKMFKGKRILILGVANRKSIAWEIANALREQGAELAFTYANTSIEKRLRPLADELGSRLVFPCDVRSDEEIEDLFMELESKWGAIDGIVHSIAFADGENLKERFSRTSREGFRIALDVSAYSLVAIAGRAQTLMKEKGGAIITMTYLGANRVVPNYKVMGVAKAALEASVRYLAADLGEYNIRVNSISAGPIKTLAASGIPQFRELMKAFAERAPLKRNISTREVAQSAVFYLSDLSSGVTGENIFVDCGYNIMGV